MFSRKYKAEFFTNYVCDVLQTLKEDEKHRITHNKRSPELSSRLNIISFMSDVAKFFKFSLQTLHLGKNLIGNNNWQFSKDLIISRSLCSGHFHG